MNRSQFTGEYEVSLRPSLQMGEEYLLWRSAMVEAIKRPPPRDSFPFLAVQMMKKVMQLKRLKELNL